MLIRNFNFIPLLRTSGLKKSILLGNKIKVKTNIWIVITRIFTYIYSVNLACVLNSSYFNKSCQFCQNVWCVAFYGQYTIWFLDRTNVLGDKAFNSVCDLDRYLP